MTSLQLRILGDFEARDGAGRSIDIQARKSRALLGVLALSPSGSAPRERLASLLWSDSGDAQARSSLRQALAALRKDFNGLAPAPIIVTDDRVAFDLAWVEIDVVAFQRCATLDDVEALRRAVNLRRGELLADVNVRDPAFEEWLAAERRRLNQLALTALEKLWSRESGEARIDIARRLVALDPLREGSHRALMQALADVGESALALQQYSVCRDLLKAELDVAPGAETEELRQRIAAGRATRGAMAAAAPDKVAIAVLPFENMSGDPEQDFFSDGIAEDIITELSRFRELQVIARKSSFQFRSAAPDLKDLAAKLGVQFVVEGSVRKAGSRVRVNVQLVDVATKSHVWADRYDRDLVDVFNIQDDITRMIVGRLVRQLEQEELERAKRKHPESLRAYELFLTAVELHERGAAEAHDQAKQLYERALEVDPKFARAHAGLAELMYFDWLLRGWGLASSGMQVAALTHARRAIECDPNDAEGHAVLGWNHLMRREFERARRHLDMAIELNPNDADICMSRANALAFLGEPKAALEATALAMRLNPYCPDWYVSDKAVIQFIAGNPEAALAIYDEMGELYPHSVIWRIAAAALVGRMEEARALADGFVVKARRLWEGDPVAGPADYARWLVDGLPFRLEADAERLRQGLRKAGLEV
jgi:TolB-like protein/Flp pilus assembly protein TadD